MDDVVIERTNDLPLRFHGQVVGIACSDGRPRWMELEVYRTSGGRYVLVGAGVSEVQGEVDRVWAETFDTPVEVRDYLLRRFSRARKTICDLITDAAEHDPAFQEALQVRV